MTRTACITHRAFAAVGVVASVLVAVALAGGVLCYDAAPAFAYQEPNTMGAAECLTCHAMVWDGMAWTIADTPAGGDCVACHGAAPDASSSGVGYTSTDVSGPHGGYTTTTRKCAACHSVHAAPATSILLLSSATVVGTCETCHDGTGGWGVYGVIAARGGTVPDNARHGVFLADGSFSTTNVIPGGDPVTGGTSTRDFSGPADGLICTDCHSVHGSDLVAPFLGERRRIRQGTPAPVSERLLRRIPTGAAAPVDEYGSDWCLACHAGRSSGGAVHNHRVESAVSWPNPVTRFVYDRLAVLNSGTSTSGTVIGRLGGTPATPLADPDLHHQTGFVNTAGNRGYMMPWPRTIGVGGQAGHYPICQQCHEDSRDLGNLAADGSAAVVPFTGTYGDGLVWDAGTGTWVPATDANPLFQNFPHETANPNMLVEPNDDLCLNCHPTSQLP